MKKIKIYGSGGQGVVTLGKIICNAAGVHANQYAKTMPEYGHERRGGSVFSDVIIDDKPILINSFIYEPDIVIVLAPSVHGSSFDVTAGIHKDSVLLINSSLPTDEYVKAFKECVYVDAGGVSLELLGKDFPNIGILGALLQLDILDKQSLVLSMKEFFGAGSDKYVNVMESAYDRTKRL